MGLGAWDLTLPSVLAAEASAVSNVRGDEHLFGAL